MDAPLAVTLKVPISYQSGEELSVGLIFTNGKELMFRLSEFKIQIARRLLSEDVFSILKDRLALIQKEYSALMRQDALGFDLGHSLLSSGYIDYLSRYSNNSLRFAIDAVDVPFSAESFDILYARFVTPKESLSHTKRQPKRRVRSMVRNYLKSKIGHQITWDAVIKQHQLEGLLFPEVKLDFAGVNGGLVLGSVHDFSKDYEVLCHELATLYTISQVKKGLSKTFLLATEPSIELSRQHQLWADFRSIPALTYIDAEHELEAVLSYIESQNLRPLDTAV